MHASSDNVCFIESYLSKCGWTYDHYSGKWRSPGLKLRFDNTGFERLHQSNGGGVWYYLCTILAEDKLVFFEEDGLLQINNIIAINLKCDP